MADALADLLREIENMRKERGELRTKNAALEADLARCQGNLQAMTEDYISECQQLRDELAKLREWKHIADGLMARAELDQHTIAALRKDVGEAVERIRRQTKQPNFTISKEVLVIFDQIAARLEVAVKEG